jgi:hypothetical protein
MKTGSAECVLRRDTTRGGITSNDWPPPVWMDAPAVYRLCVCGTTCHSDAEGNRIPCRVCGSTLTRDEAEEWAKLEEER